MFGMPRRTSLALVGWLWADLLLGLMALFLVANSAGAPIKAAEGIDPQPVEIEVEIDGRTLLTGSAGEVDREQARIAGEAQAALADQAEGRRVAIVLAFARHASPAEGDKLALLATADLKKGQFAGSVIQGYHELAAGDRGSLLTLVVYVFQ